MTKRGRLLGTVGVALLGTVGVVVAAFAIWQMLFAAPDGPRPPAPGDALFVSPDSFAARAAGDGGEDASTEAAAYLAAQPTAVWLTPETYPIGSVTAAVEGILAQARAQDATPVLAVYGLPDRDCGNFSAGGLDAEAYPGWIDAISAGLAADPARSTVVILEPDALALDCERSEERTAQIADAASRLAAENTFVYVDGGHSNWRSVSEMATLIAEVAEAAPGAIRGFATNVSNANSDADESAYARQVVGQLEAWGFDDLHAVIDTSRNGAPHTGSEWCNVPGLRVGATAGTWGDDVVDTNLWIKPPGESDGTCNGGPVAGVWWPEAAVELTRDIL
ncbi:glycoside hydrolase family 6 protein [Microbacterium sp. NPDC077184]|uniref:glycoside hydrolase family 6 protein n=1 Tax=Microbacterium sp. NPDC077184 TaxID=3154764 RepID=UPI0034126F8B